MDDDWVDTLYSAVRRGDMQEVYRLVGHQVYDDQSHTTNEEINTDDEDDKVRNDETMLVDISNMPLRCGMTALHVAVGREPVDGTFDFTSQGELIEELLERGANVNGLDRQNRTPLHLATRVHNIGAVRQLLRANADVSLEDADGDTALHCAVQAFRHSAFLVRLLLEHGAPVNARNRECLAPLQVAASIGLPETVDALLEAGADVHVLDRQGRTVLHRVCSAGFNATGELLDYRVSIKGRNWTKEPQYEQSCRETLCHGLVSTLLERGANVTVADHHGNTVLHNMADCGYDKVIQTLLKYGAFVNVVNNEGASPLHVAADRCSIKTVDLLLSNGADVDVRNGSKQTALQMVCVKDSDDTNSPADTEGKRHTIIYRLLHHHAEHFSHFSDVPRVIVGKVG